MKELNELVDRYDVSYHCGAVDVRPKQDGHLVMYSDYVALEQRAEAAEAELAEVEQQKAQWVAWAKEGCAEADRLKAKLTELEKQEPVAWTSQANLDTLKSDSRKTLEFMTGDKNIYSNPVPLYVRPAPAINLAELVPGEVNRGNEDVFDVGFANGFNACRAAMLRNIEEQSQ